MCDLEIDLLISDCDFCLIDLNKKIARLEWLYLDMLVKLSGKIKHG